MHEESVLLLLTLPPPQQKRALCVRKREMAAVGDYSSVGGGGYGSAGCQCLTKFVEEGSVESRRYYLSRRTVWEMLRDRGYDVAESELTRSLAEFRREFGDQPDLKLLRISASLRSNPNSKIAELLVNITQHILAPRYDILTAEQKQQMLTKYMAEDKQLPRMLVTDAVPQYYGLEKGQVVKITYSGGLVDSLVTYRCIA